MGSHTCPSPSSSERLAVLGILSYGANFRLRSQIRAAWLNASSSNLFIARFVLRGGNAPPSQVSEAEVHQDIIFVPARHDLGRKHGPLASLILWWRCALAAWPNAAFIGKVCGPPAHSLDRVACRRSAYRSR